MPTIRIAGEANNKNTISTTVTILIPIIGYNLTKEYRCKNFKNVYDHFSLSLPLIVCSQDLLLRLRHN